MKKLLSLPPNLVNCFHDVTGLDKNEWFCTHDPIDKKLGSGGGTTWVMQACPESFAEEKKIIIHAGGQSRRLPAYAPSGKILTPIPVFRWERGQKLSQNLLSLQVPLYERIMEKANDKLRTMIVSGDVYIRSTKPLQDIPDADVVCYGLWLKDEIAMNHGVFVSARETPETLKCMLQKPSAAELNEIKKDHYTLVDIGIWILSDRAVERLKACSTDENGDITEFDLYSEFGGALGTSPTRPNKNLEDLTVAVLPLPGGEFYHYGTTRELLSSTLAIQNIVVDQREIIHRDRKAHPSIFVQNAYIGIKFTDKNENVWVENSYIGNGWSVTKDNVITGVPENDWNISLSPQQCIDIVPVGDDGYAVRTYGFYDKFAGSKQQEKIFPIVHDTEAIGMMIAWMLGNNTDEGTKAAYDQCEKLSAEEICMYANLKRLAAQRAAFMKDNWKAIAKNHNHSVFYQTDLFDAAAQYAKQDIVLPDELGCDTNIMTRIHDAMFRAEVIRQNGGSTDDVKKWEAEAFGLLQQGLTAPMLIERQSPKMSVYSDQIVWGRSPVRIDLAGGWSDTPPYCLMEGGAVVNMAIDLNGQQPIQTYVRPCKERHIVLRSIDLGAEETITTYEELRNFSLVGSPFSIPKAALVLCGFNPGFSKEHYATLKEQLEDFGCGIEVTLLSAIPAGSGLGTSSILAATVLGTLSDFCSLNWDKNEIGQRTLVLEQLLTTGGGWQDQFGGLLSGVKILTTHRGFDQHPQTRWLPTNIFTQSEHKACHLLYYTGITRTAKTLLAEIVRKMFLNHGAEIQLLREMKQHAHDMYEAIQANNFEQVGQLIGKTWTQNQMIDHGTNPESVRKITEIIDDLCLGYKLPGAGGGGYLYMVAKDPEAAAIIKKRLTNAQPNPNARFVEMSLSETGLQISRS